MPKEHYRPLPSNLTIKKSGIEGLGLFATKEIRLGKVLGVSHVEIKYTDVEALGDMIIRTPLGGFINHSATPNCKRIKSELYDCWYLMTLKDIKSHEELTLKYTFYTL